MALVVIWSEENFKISEWGGGGGFVIARVGGHHPQKKVFKKNFKF